MAKHEAIDGVVVRVRDTGDRNRYLSVLTAGASAGFTFAAAMAEYFLTVQTAMQNRFLSWLKIVFLSAGLSEAVPQMFYHVRMNR